MASKVLTKELQQALHYLYDPAVLSKSPLLVLFGIQNRIDAPTALQNILIEAVQKLKPLGNLPHESSIWRIYQVLTYRFIEQSGQKEVASELSLSTRHLRRLEDQAIEWLADVLTKRYNIPELDNASIGALKEEQKNPGVPSQEQELDWLRKSSINKTTDIAWLINTVINTILPLSKMLRVQIDYVIPEALPYASGQMTTLRQVLLVILTSALRSVPNGKVNLVVEASEEDIIIFVRTVNGHFEYSKQNTETIENIAQAQRLIGLSGGSLIVDSGKNEGQAFTVKIILPVSKLISVLVIDDNKDVLQLLERYLSGSRYRFIGEQDPLKALATAEGEKPQIIVLDVMLPGIDGWEILGRLREHPNTRGIPVIICTILNQETLALTLGAAGFVLKPINREAFLTALDQQAARLEQEPQ